MPLSALWPHLALGNLSTACFWVATGSSHADPVVPILIASVALTTPCNPGEAALKILPPGPHADFLSRPLSGPQGPTHISVFSLASD